ncbi:MAG: AMP-binding protein [Rhizomicrobium sp.]
MNVQVKSTDLPPFKPLPMKAPDIEVTRKPDGTVYLSSRHPLGEMHRSTVHLFEARAAVHPDRKFIAERTPLPGGGTGDWRFITYGEMNARANAIAQAMLTRGMGPDTPLMVLSGNSIAHASMMFGAMKARVPVRRCRSLIRSYPAITESCATSLRQRNRR